MENKLFLRPCLVVLSGVPLSGKTVLAEKLIRLSNLEMIDVDVIRNEIDESRKKDGQIKMLEQELEKAVVIRAYTEMCRQAENNVIHKGIPTIITGTFSRVKFKHPLEELAQVLKEKQIPLKVFLLVVSDEEAMRRIEKRKKEGSLSNIDSLEKYHWAKGIFSRIEFSPVTIIDTSEANHVEQVMKDLEELKVS